MLDRCREWYTSLGLVIATNTPGEFVFFDTGNGTMLGIHTATKPGLAEATVYLEVDDVDAAYERLTRAGVQFDRRPETKPWGAKAVTLRDPPGIDCRCLPPAPD